MYLPPQSRAVNRTLVGHPFVSQSCGPDAGVSTEEMEQGMRAGEYGIQPSDAGSVISSLLPIFASLF